MHGLDVTCGVLLVHAGSCDKEGLHAIATEHMRGARRLIEGSLGHTDHGDSCGFMQVPSQTGLARPQPHMTIDDDQRWRLWQQFQNRQHTGEFPPVKLPGLVVGHLRNVAEVLRLGLIIRPVLKQNGGSRCAVIVVAHIHSGNQEWLGIHGRTHDFAFWMSCSFRSLSALSTPAVYSCGCSRRLTVA